MRRDKADLLLIRSEDPEVDSYGQKHSIEYAYAVRVSAAFEWI